MLDEPPENEFLSSAYRALLENRDFDPLLSRLVETASRLSACATVVLRSIDDRSVDESIEGPWSTEPEGSALLPARPSLAMPVVVDGVATHVLDFYKLGHNARFTPSELEHARRLADVAGLVLNGASLGGQFGRLSRIDDATGVLARVGFEEDVARALEDNDQRAGLIIVRAADLEAINARWGREVGDEVLRLVARAIRDAIGNAGTVGRLRRHEFGAVLPGADYETTTAVAALTREWLASPLPVLGMTGVQATIAVGAAAAKGGNTTSVVPLLHATYKAVDADERSLGPDGRSRRFIG